MLCIVSNLPKALVSALLLAIPVTSLSARRGDAWKSSVSPFGLKQVWCEFPMTNGATARFTYRCAQDRPERHASGVLALELTIFPEEKLQDFHLGSLMGPDAPAGNRKLMRIRVYGAEGKVLCDTRTALGVVIPVEPRSALSFCTGAERRLRHSPTRRVLDAINAGGKELEITITDPEDAKRVIQVRCPLAGAEEAFRTLLDKP